MRDRTRSSISKSMVVVSCLALGVALAVPAWAQTSTAAAPTGPVADAPKDDAAEIVVTGIRASLESAATIKRQASSVVDVISSEDIGAFPDQNIAESLQRITGVQITRSRGEGQKASIRGLDPKFGTVILNGQTLTSVGGSRSFDFTILSSDFVSALEVYKSPTADLPEGGIAGTLNIKTLSPLDLKKRRLAVNMEGIYEQYSGRIGPHVSALYADTFFNDRIGVVIGVDYSKRYVRKQSYDAFGMDKRIESGVPGNIDWNGDGDRNDYYRFSHVAALTDENGTRERRSIIGGLEWQATDTLRASYTVLASTFDSHLALSQQSAQFHLSNGSGRQSQILVDRHISSIAPFTDDVGTGSITKSSVTAANGDIISQPSGVPIRGIVDMIDEDNARGINNTRLNFTDDKTIFHSFGLAYDDDEHWSVVARGSLSKTTEYLTQLSLEAASLASIRVDLRTDPSRIPTMQYMRGFDPLNPANYTIESLNGKLNEPYVDRNHEGQIDFTYRLGGGALRAIRFGAKVSERQNSIGNRVLSISAGQLANLLGVSGVATNASRFSALGYMSSFGGNGYLGRYNGASAFPRTFIASDVFKAIDKLGGIGALGSLNGQTVNGVTVSAPITTSLPSTSFVQESVWSGYARADFASDDDRLTGNVGLRAILTDQQSSGFQPNLSQVQFITNGATTFVPSAGPSHLSRSYTDFLPSLNMAFRPTDSLVLRFAAARTLTRPDLGLLAPSAAVSGTSLTITDTNPMLEPFRAKQLDLSMEWYAGRDSLLSAALFYKDVDGLTITQADSVTLSVNEVAIAGGTSTGTRQIVFVRTRPINGASTKIKGLELNFQRTFSFLPGLLSGLGTQLNYTFIDADDVPQSVGTVAKLLPLAGVSKHSFNIVGFYEKGPVTFRAAYNYRSSYAEDPVASRQDGIYVAPIAQLDASLKVAVTDWLSMTLDGTNLTDEPIERTNQYGFGRGYEVNGRRVTFGLRASF